MRTNINHLKKATNLINLVTAFLKKNGAASSVVCTHLVELNNILIDIVEDMKAEYKKVTL